jgi:hypothetical protein
MKSSISPIYRSIPLIAACLLCLTAVAAARGQTEQKSPGRPCVLLKNDNVLFGQAHQFGEFIIIRTGPNDELKLPRAQVACWAKSLADLYRYRLDHRSSGDLKTHLIDARWCLQYELYVEAAKELEAAKSLSPDHREVLLLEGLLQRRSQPTVTQTIPVAPVTTTTFLQESASYEDGPNDNGDANRVDPRTLKGFASHVQLTLINKCGRCHNQDSELDWRLTMPSSGSRPTARITRENLTAVLRFVDRANPDQSPLLIMGTSPHGGGDAPLKIRNAKAIEALKRWLAFAGRSAHQGRLGKIDRPRQPSSEAPVEPIASIAQVSYTSDVRPNVNQPNAALPVSSSKESNHPKRLPTVANPFDPSLFNRRFHRDDK